MNEVTIGTIFYDYNRQQPMRVVNPLKFKIIGRLPGNHIVETLSGEYAIFAYYTHEIVAMLERAQAQSNAPTSGVYLCRYCGELAGESRYSHDARLRANRHCFRCDYWYGLVEQAQSGELTQSIRVNGVHYVAHNMSSEPARYRGRGGGRYFRHESGAVIESNDVWWQGKIPHIFRSKLPDNATIISQEEYEEAIDNA
jgi:hypothetical protein